MIVIEQILYYPTMRIHKITRVLPNSGTNTSLKKSECSSFPPWELTD